MKIPGLCITALIILAAGAIAGWACSNELFRNDLMALAAFGLAIPYVFAVTLVALMLYLKQRKLIWQWSLPVVVGYAALGSIFLFDFVGGAINRWEVASTENYVDRAVPVLDQMHALAGSYPKELPVSKLGEPPYLLKQYGGYSSNGSSYQFKYIDEPAGWAGGEGMLMFTDSDRRWQEER